MINNREIVKYTPVVTVILFESGGVMQMLTMFQEQSSADQSLVGWILGGVALTLWYNWYRLFTPDQWLARRSTLLGIATQLIGIGVILWWRL